MEALKKILIFVDQTPQAERVVKFGYLMAHKLNAEVTLLQVENLKQYRMDMLITADAAESMKTFKNSRHFLEN